MYPETLPGQISEASIPALSAPVKGGLLSMQGHFMLSDAEQGKRLARIHGVAA